MSVLRKLLGSEVELVKERGSALILTAQRLEELVRELEQVTAELALAAPDAEPAKAKRVARVRAAAAHQLWNLIVQREAIGLWNHDDVYAQYRVPRSLVPSPKAAE